MSTEPWRDAPDLLDLPSATLDVWRAEVASRAGARTVLRVLLGRYLRHRPDTIEFAVGPHGKPALAGSGVPALHFNMSHTRGLALYAVARDIEVGADVERPRPGIDTVRLARRFITPREAGRLAALAPAERDAEFLRAWVRHEATVKCIGTGIGSAQLGTLSAGDLPWVAELDPGDGAAAAVAAGVPPQTVRCWRWRGPTTSDDAPGEAEGPASEGRANFRRGTLESGAMDDSEIAFDERGLVPCIVQDHRSGEVLTLAYMNAESLRLTRETGEMHFFSRSRQELWHKGATSGNTQALRAIRIDCDGDALLALVEPAGPACHTGERTCFYRGGFDAAAPYEVLPTLERTIASRAQERPDGSYTASLLADPELIGAKVEEEAEEVARAAREESDERLAEEAADVLYHLAVLLRGRGLSLQDAERVLDGRRRA